MNPYFNYGQQPYNPYETPGQRLARMEQQLYQQPAYPQQQPAQYQQQPVPPPGITILLVDSEEEARSSQLDITGAVQFFRDRSTGRIYTKQFDPKTANILFDTYEKSATTTAEQQPDKLDTLLNEIQLLRRDLNHVSNDLKERICQGDCNKNPKSSKSKPKNSNDNT